MGYRVIPIDVDVAYSMYVSGISCRDVAKHFQCAHQVLVKRLRDAGYEVSSTRRPVTKKQYVCKNCGEIFERYEGIINDTTYCSRTCYNTYRGGLRKHDNRTISTKTWLKIRKNLLTTKGECGLCGSNDRLCIHHILPRRDYPELVYVVNNLIVLCKACHCRTSGKEYEFAGHFLRLTCKGGELLGNLSAFQLAYGNQQPSRSNVIELVDRKVHRLMGEESQSNKPNTSAAPERDDIVGTIGKPIEVVA